MRRASVLMMGFALLAGCGPKRSEMGNGKVTSDVKPSQYSDALKEWSRNEKVYQQLETRLIVSATYRSGAFRDAYIDEYARRYLLSDNERDAMRKREHDAASTYQEFFFAAYTPESRQNDFSRRNSMWRIRLFDDKGNSVDPLVVTKQKDNDPVLHAFFPYFSLWTKGYVVKFPRAGLDETSKTLRLQISSATGATEMTYDKTHADTSNPVRVENDGQTVSAVTTPAPTPAP